MVSPESLRVNSRVYGMGQKGPEGGTVSSLPLPFYLHHPVLESTRVSKPALCVCPADLQSPETYLAATAMGPVGPTQVCVQTTHSRHRLSGGLAPDDRCLSKRLGGAGLVRFPQALAVFPSNSPSLTHTQVCPRKKRPWNHIISRNSL